MLKRDKKDNRFEIIFSEGSQVEGLRQIIVDKETGINYLVWKGGYAGGITPLLDAEGKPVITR